MLNEYIENENSIYTKLAGKTYLKTILALLCLQIVFIFFSTDEKNTTINGMLIKILILQAVVAFVVVLPTILAIIKNNINKEFLGIKKFKIKDFLLGLIALVASMPICNLINAILIMVFGEEVDNVSQLIIIFRILPKGYWILIFIVMAVLPGIFEELQFRGLYVGCFGNKGSFKAAIITALMFSLMHMNFIQLSYTFIIGLILYYIRVATGSSILTMLLHFLFNAYSLFMVFIADDETINTELMAQEISDNDLYKMLIILLVIGIVGVLITILILRHMMSKRVSYYGENKEILMKSESDCTSDEDYEYKEVTGKNDNVSKIGNKIFSFELIVACIVAFIVTVGSFLVTYN